MALSVTPRSLIFIALFNLAIGAGVIVGWLCGGLNFAFYDDLVEYQLPQKPVSLTCNGVNGEGVCEYVAYDYLPPVNIPIVPLNKSAAVTAFAVQPPAPMDWAVLLLQLHSQGVKKLAISAPLVWSDQSNDLVTRALSEQLEKFDEVVVDKTVSLSSRETPVPPEWEKLALTEGQYVGDVSKVPPANKLFGEDSTHLANSVTAPSRVENDELFQVKADSDVSAPLFIRWQNRIIPTSPLLNSLVAMNIKVADIHVHFGKVLRLGDKVRLPIDQTGRIRLRPVGDPLILLPGDVISSPDNPALRLKQESMKETLTNAPLTMVWEPSADTDEIEPFALAETKTIGNVISGIAPTNRVFLSRLPDYVMWILLVDLAAIALWALRFKTKGRCFILAACFIAIPTAQFFFFKNSGMWIPMATFLGTLLFVCGVSFFVSPSEQASDEPSDSGDDNDSQNKGRHVEAFDFQEPNEVPIPHKK